MFSKINVSDIFIDHINTLRNERTGKIYAPDLVLFFAAPVFISGVFVHNGLVVKTGFATVLLAAFSAFTALLLNLLLLVFDIADKMKRDNRSSDVSKSDKNRDVFLELLREIYINVSFCILISVFSIVIVSGFFVGVDSKAFIGFLSFVIYSISLNFFLTLLMILKRIYRLLSAKIPGISVKR